PETRATFRATNASDTWRERIKDVLLGVGFLLAVAAFLLSWRNAQKLRHFQAERGASAPREDRHDKTRET
ncbi:MAG: hypothetical protein ACRELG_11320, partial [Gemmataceae bacterium]